VELKNHERRFCPSREIPSVICFKTFRHGKLIGGKGASVQRIVTATVALTRLAGKSVKRRAGSAMSNPSLAGVNKEGRDLELATSLPLISQLSPKPEQSIRGKPREKRPCAPWPKPRE
jgi:hypothetical protein